MWYRAGAELVVVVHLLVIGFIAHYLVKVIYPPGLTHGMQFGLGVLLLLVAVIGYWGFLRRRGRAGREPWPMARAGTWGRTPPAAVQP
jgi:hypothetical protein